MEEERVISLQSYATVMAGLGAGLDLRSALDHAEVSPREWDRSAEHWQSRIDESAASDLVVLVELDAALLAARRRFEPTIEPIASDAEAWACFRRHFATAVDPFAFLSEHEVSPAAYARLEADWANRAIEDEELARSLQQYMLAPLEPCPTLTRVPASSAYRREAPAPDELPTERPAPLIPAVSRPVAEIPPLDLYVPPIPAVPLPAIIHAVHPAVVVEPPLAEADADMDEPSSRTLDLSPDGDEPSAPTLPFKDAAPPVPLERYAVMLADATLFGMTEAGLCQKHGVTPHEKARAFYYWEMLLDFDPKVRERVRAVMDRYHRAASGRPAEAAPPDVAMAPDLAGRTSAPDADRPIDATGPIDVAKLNAALPFPDHDGGAPIDATGPIDVAKLNAALPFPDHERPAPEILFGLTLEQHACLCAEIDRSPAQAKAALARYRVTEEQKASLDARWRARLSASGALKARWDDAYRRYRSHLDAGPR